MNRPSEAAVPERNIKEWIIALENICMSPEVRELIARLEKEDHAFPQTVIRLEQN